MQKDVLQYRCGTAMTLKSSAVIAWFLPIVHLIQVFCGFTSKKHGNAFVTKLWLCPAVIPPTGPCNDDWWGSATAVEPDGSGRILLPPSLREFSGLEKRIVMLGMGARFELWNENTLNQKRSRRESG